MDTHLEPHDPIPLDDLFLDVNNPRLAPENPPGYLDPKVLFDPKIQKELEKRAETTAFDLDALEAAMVGQGWMPIDSILVWEHPDEPGKFVVVEGNRRLATLRLRILPGLKKAKQKLERMLGGGGGRYSKQDVKDQQDLVDRLDRLAAETDRLDVLRVNAATPEDLDQTLNRILAVRHITGPREWGNYAEHLWLLQRYEDLFERQLGETASRWESSVIKQVAAEASLSEVKTKRYLRAASAYSRFKRDFEDDLPEDEEFDADDYYLFESLVRERYPREQFGLTEDTMYLPEDKAQVLFDWVFKKPRPQSADDNENVFYRHENIRDWAKMARYDDKHNTHFADRFDVDNPDSAPAMHAVEADFHAHKARKTPTSVIGSLLGQLKSIDAETIRAEGEFLQIQLEELADVTKDLLLMVEAVEA